MMNTKTVPSDSVELKGLSNLPAPIQRVIVEGAVMAVGNAKWRLQAICGDRESYTKEQQTLIGYCYSLTQHSDFMYGFDQHNTLDFEKEFMFHLKQNGIPHKEDAIEFILAEYKETYGVELGCSLFPDDPCGPHCKCGKGAASSPTT